MHGDRGIVRSLFVLVLIVSSCCVRTRAQTVSTASHVKWQREEVGAASGLHDQTLQTIYAALPEQLGLRLESGKGEVLVIDHIEQPSDN